MEPPQVENINKQPSVEEEEDPQSSEKRRDVRSTPGRKSHDEMDLGDSTQQLAIMEMDTAQTPPRRS